MRTLVFLVGLCAIALAHRADRLDSIDVKPFRPDTEYSFRYDAQVAAGLSPDASEQNAATRIEAKIKLAIHSEEQAVLRMQDIRFGQLNEEVYEPQNMKPMRSFEQKSISEEQRRQLQLPAQIRMQDGLVMHITFHEEDSAWSKNVKRGVINLIQLNLKRQNTDAEDESREIDNSMDKTMLSFSQKETTLEGKCKVAYTVNKAEQKQQSEEEERRFNVTKSIDFTQCSEVADVAYGFHSQEIQSWCTQALKTDEQEKKEQPRRLCDTKEVKERKIARSSVFRYTLAGKPTNYGIEKAEVVSQYIVKSLNAQAQQATSQIVVIAQLTYEDASEVSKRSERVSGKEESLLYNAEQEREEKRFYMHGDEERQSPFEEVANKAGLAKQIAHRMLEAWQQHIETDASLQLSRLVDVLRMSTVSELNKIWKTLGRGNTGLALKSEEQDKLEQVFQDALAIAGTRNTIHILVEKIMNGEIPTEKAVQAMKSLAGVPAPSDKQVKEIERLCKSDLSRSSAPLKQSCWLAYGNLVADLCREKPVQAKSPEGEFETEKLCPRETKEHIKKTLMEQVKSADSTYEKILALKALGNAGLDIAVNEIEEIIRNLRQEPIVRIQAIDSLRRLRHQMPHKIHRMLMPLFENNREQPEVRMAAFAMIMHTIPEQSIMDQITYALLRERSENVKSFVVTTSEALAQSTIPAEKEMAKHLKNALKMAKIEGENLRSSRQYRVPIYSEEHKEGLFLNMASMVSTRNALPAHIAARMDLLLNDELERNAFEVHLSQQDVERWYEKALELISEGTARPTRGQRNQRRGSDQLRSMHSERGYKSRRSQIGSEDEREQPFGILCVRVGDVDHVILPIAEQHMPRQLKNALQGEKPKLSELLSAISISKQFRMASAMVYGEKKAMIPTSIGLPLRFKQSAPVLTSVHGSLKIDASSQRPTAQLRIHTVATPVYEQKVEIWSPIAVSGITTRQSAELQLPIDVHVQVEKEQLKITAKLPQQKHTILTVHTLPATYTVDAPEKREPQQEQKLQSIRSRRVEHQQQEVEHDMSRSLGVPLALKAHYHRPAKVSYRDLVNVFTITQNTIRVEYEPSEQTPEQLEFQASWSLFEKVSAGKLELKDFFRETKFDDIYSSEETDSMELDNQNDRNRRLNNFVDSYKPNTMYKHNIKMSAKTIGGRRQHQISMEINGQCEPRMTYCKMDVKADANRDWQMAAQLQSLLPQTVQTVEQLEKLGEKQKHFVAKLKAEWGSDKQQQLTVSVQGEPAMTRHQRNVEQKIASHRPQFKTLTRFVNKYDVEASYKLSTQAQQNVNSAYEALKAYYYWQSSTELKDGSDGTVHVSAIIDPITRRHANLTVKTPTERVRMQSIELPMHTRPMPFIRRQTVPKHSVSAVVSALSYARNAECRVENRRVRTFDDVIYGAALPKCYTAIAKDCTSEEPRFAVLMKRISDDNQDKKLKVITEDAVIEVKPKGDSLYVKVNDERMSEDWEEQARLGIHMDAENNEIVIEVPSATVRFNGQEATVSVSPIYKNGLCGLCGHYDEEGDDELRMKNNELTSDLKEFHRSYVHPTEDECTNDEFESFYEKQKFESIRSQEWDSQEDDSDDYYSENGRPRREQQKWRKQNEDDSQEKPEPIEKTQVMEYHNKICLSMKPVKTCPKGTDVEETTEKTVPFKCFPRSDIQAQRKLKQARNGDVLDLADEEQSLSHSVKMARTCVPAF
ncbi:VIT-2 protein [Aphelenchoides avenae]|nr:VIT-2 protein [Aphelenchus avenae]